MAQVTGYDYGTGDDKCEVIVVLGEETFILSDFIELPKIDTRVLLEELRKVTVAPQGLNVSDELIKAVQELDMQPVAYLSGKENLKGEKWFDRFSKKKKRPR